MWLCVLFLIYYGSSPSVSAVTKDLNKISAVPVNDAVLHERWKRQAGQCRLGQWKCRDGTCIGIEGKCDGNIDCPDGSDETHPLCRKIKCQANWFRCTYGACVDGTAPCNGIIECADQSDELLPKCRNETDVTQGRFRCQNGNYIPASDYCDGIPDCPDGSDETVRACAGKKCQSHLFQCAYGACVDQRADCNGQKECVDGSDESEELCSKMVYRPPSNNRAQFNKPALSGKCVLPPYPDHGRYEAKNVPYATPGQGFPSLHLNVTCDPGYGVVDTNVVFCQDGSWSNFLPECVLFCKLDRHPSVTYHCLVSGNVEGQRECNAFEPSGTVIRPECNSPNYHSHIPLAYMRCRNGMWNYVAVCDPECGRLTPDGIDLIIDGRPALRGELPWHVGIYRKSTKPGKPPKQICGGSLVTNTVVISAAHCFWDDVGLKQPAANYAVAIAKLFRDWNSAEDKDAQKSDVKDIQVPTRFQGRQGNFQEDIAMVILETPFIYHNYVRPVCLNFDESFHDRQLRHGNLGKVAGWGLTDEKGNPSSILKVVELPYVDIEECIRTSPLTFRENLTGDKICAGYKNGTALCKGDSGGGLAFSQSDQGIDRYYLRGVVSTAPRGEYRCNPFTFTAFTEILRHERYIKQFL